MHSIIIPVHNEVQSLRELHEQIVAATSPLQIPYEIIYVDDGSTDGSWNAIRHLSQIDARVAAVRLRKNFGKAAALTAGMRAARGEVLFMMDADLQDDPAEIAGLLETLADGYDVVNGWKRQRLDPWHKVLPSRVFNRLVSWLTGLWLHDHNCGLKCFRRQVADELRIYGEMHRFIPVLAHARGFRVTERPVRHRPRPYGQSKYGVRRFVRGFLDLLTVKFLTGFGQRPQHMLGAIGLLFVALGGAGLTYLAIIWLLTNLPPHLRFDPIGSRPLLAYSAAALLLGGQLVSLGFLAELIVAFAGRERDWYSVAETIGTSSAAHAADPREP
jgi:glycosyltransferase involved in cell wall biosynthesis